MSNIIGTDEKVVAGTIEAMKLVEEKCDEAISRIAEISRQGPELDRIIDVPLTHLGRTKHFAQAVQRFPLFDPSCLSGLREFKFKNAPSLWDGGQFSGTLYLPRLAWIPYHGSGRSEMRMSVAPGRDLYPSDFGGIRISFDMRMLEKNSQVLRDANARGVTIEVSTSIPAIPESVQRRVGQVRNWFESIQVVAEAEWTAAPQKDPLVVGIIYGQAFLIDQFDTTKLERYIASEFTVRK